MNANGVGSAEIDRVVACVRDHARATALGAFAYAVLASQAERKLTQIDAAFVQSAANEHGIDREAAATPAGNLLAVLENGPRDSQQSLLVGGFAAAGFGNVCLAAKGGERRAAAIVLVEHLSWLEMATPYRVTPFLGVMLPGEIRGVVEDALIDAILGEDGRIDPAAIDGAARARNAARLTTLARTQSDAARTALGRVSDQANDPATRAVARALLGDHVQLGLAAAHPLRVHGVAHAPSRRLPFAIIRWVTGIALLSALYRTVCFLLALRREAEIELEGGLLRVRGRTTFLGKTVRSTEACYTLDRINGAFRRARFALLGSAVGVISLSCGVLLGGHLLFDGVRGGAPFLLIAGAAAVLLGAALDLAIEVLLPARKGQVELQVDVVGARSVRVSRVPLLDADRLLSALAERVALQTG
ncbi:MAG TPA: hypothetical protein VFG30_02050 [Polyangiales bacterium]|nr:hypothetical protein [Polyangiales bacterium]